VSLSRYVLFFENCAERSSQKIKLETHRCRS
jgi:hypothetical protein